MVKVGIKKMMMRKYEEKSEFRATQNAELEFDDGESVVNDSHKFSLLGSSSESLVLLNWYFGTYD